MAILLIREHRAYIDDEDVSKLDGWICGVKKHHAGLLYVRCEREVNGEQQRVYLHRLLLGVPKGDQRRVDHIDRNGLNCRRSNLRFADNKQQSYNKLRQEQTEANPYMGVHRRFLKSGVARWMASANHNNKLIGLGTFMTAEEAAEARDAFVLQYRGEFACTNFDYSERGKPKSRTDVRRRKIRGKPNAIRDWLNVASTSLYPGRKKDRADEEVTLEDLM